MESGRGATGAALSGLCSTGQPKAWGFRFLFLFFGGMFFWDTLLACWCHWCPQGMIQGVVNELRDSLKGNHMGVIPHSLLSTSK